QDIYCDVLWKQKLRRNYSKIDKRREALELEVQSRSFHSLLVQFIECLVLSHSEVVLPISFCALSKPFSVFLECQRYAVLIDHCALLHRLKRAVIEYLCSLIN
ncbi:hypothetical protein PMAYCL1PPCAC_11336, partial [Pristionchus mayeri]